MMFIVFSCSKPILCVSSAYWKIAQVLCCTVARMPLAKLPESYYDWKPEGFHRSSGTLNSKQLNPKP